jgi:hypothetical protein
VIPRRYKRTSDEQWATQLVAALEANAGELRVLQAEQTALIRLAHDSGVRVWLIAAATGLSRSHVYRAFPEKKEAAA